LSFVFFTDRDLGKRFPETLAAAGLAVERLDDLFPPNCADEQVARSLQRDGPRRDHAQPADPLYAEREMARRPDSPGTISLWYAKRR
jgi:hypothetical protein